MTLRSFYSQGFSPENSIMGKVTGTFLLSQFPDVPCKVVTLKAYSSNGSSIFIGNSRSTGSYPSVPRLPWELAAGNVLENIPIDNLNRIYMAGCSGSLYISYWAMG